MGGRAGMCGWRGKPEGEQGLSQADYFRMRPSAREGEDSWGGPWSPAGRSLQLPPCPFILMPLWRHPENIYVSQGQCPAGGRGGDGSCQGRKAGWDGLTRHVAHGARESQQVRGRPWPWPWPWPHGGMWRCGPCLLSATPLPHLSLPPRVAVTVSLSTGKESYGYHWILRMRMGPLGGGVLLDL